MDYPSLYVDGRRRPPRAPGEILAVHAAATGGRIGSVAAASPADVDDAVAAAARAQPAWSATSPAERADWLVRLADGLEARQGEIAAVISQEVGTPIRISTAIQAGQPVAIARYYAELGRRWSFESQVGHSLILREPWGVVGAITPWNYPLHQILAKVAPALAAGCTVVLKPSDLAPLNACLLGDVCEAIQLPPGLLNILPGGAAIGEAIVRHPGVDMVSFTGSVPTGKRILALAAERIAKVTLELGGKSACVLLEDAPFEKAVAAGVKNALLNSGQTCSAWTRMVVPRARVADVVDLATQAMATLPLGDPLDPATRLGPLISERQRARVEGYIRQGVAEGAVLVAGGGRPAHLPHGHYVEPTLFSAVTTAMRVAQEEIFGPVLVVMAYDHEPEAVAIANATIYGLAGAVWSADGERALAVARQIRAGQVDINGGRYNLAAPFGGYKQSGLGREFGEAGLEEFLQMKALAR